MKDDLISRKLAINAVKIPDDGCVNSSERHGIIYARVEARRAIQSIPSVPAVPLDKLCEFLEKCGADSYCGTCKQIMGGCFTDGNGCGSEHFWKELLTKWMETNNE